MPRRRRESAVVPWVRAPDTPLPEAYRVNLNIRDPELIAFLTRGVPHGQITGAIQTLMKEGYERMVGSGLIDPAQHLSGAEIGLIRSGHRKAAKAVRDESAETAPPRAPTIPRARPEAPVASIARPAPSRAAAPEPAPVTAASRLIDDDDADVLLGAQG